MLAASWRNGQSRWLLDRKSRPQGGSRLERRRRDRADDFFFAMGIKDVAAKRTLRPHEISKRYRRTTQPAFWPAAPMRRTSVLPQAKPRRRRNSPHSRWRLCRLTDVAYPLRVLPPSIEIPKGGADQRSAKPKKKDTLKACLSFWYARLDSNQRPTESESVTLSS